MRSLKDKWLNKVVLLIQSLPLWKSADIIQAIDLGELSRKQLDSTNKLDKHDPSPVAFYLTHRDQDDLDDWDPSQTIQAIMCIPSF